MASYKFCIEEGEFARQQFKTDRVVRNFFLERCCAWPPSHVIEKDGALLSGTNALHVPAPIARGKIQLIRQNSDRYTFRRCPGQLR